MQNLDERLTQLRDHAEERRKDAAMCRRKASDFEQEAMVIEAEIRGIETALGALQPQAGNGAEPPRTRRERRDIKALVNEFLARPRTFSLPMETEKLAAHIASQINCRPSQVLPIIKRMANERAGSPQSA